MTERKLYIVDGHSHLYAAYFAIRNLSSPSGEPTNATYGVTSVLLKILREHKPDYLVAVFDPPGKTFRSELYPEYKANRPPMAEDLAVQIRRCHQVLEAMGVPVIVVPGYEADDVIATLAEKARAAGIKTVICSKDKDLQQLLDGDVVIYDSTKEKMIDTKVLDTEKGVSAGQIIDFLALMGDTTDNVPGVPGVGPKTAAKLIQEYGSLNGVIENKDKLTPKVREFFSDPRNVEKIRLSQRLVTLRKDVPLRFEPEQWRPEIPDRGRLATLLTELGFTRFIQQFGLEEASQELREQARVDTQIEKPQFRQVRSLEELETLARRFGAGKRLSVDTETTGTDPMASRLVGVSLCADDREAFYVPLRSVDGQHLEADKALAIFKALLEDAKVGKVGQNLKYDLIVLRNAGIELANVAFDSMVASYLLDPSRAGHNLDLLAKEFLGYDTIKIGELIGKGRNQLTLDQVPAEAVTEYSAEDAWVAWRLCERLGPPLRENHLLSLFEEVEMPLVRVLADMEYRGVTIDTEKLAKLSNRLGDQLLDLTRRIHQQVGRSFNIDSPKQLAEVLFDELSLPVGRLTKTGRSTDGDVLESLAWKHPVPKMVLEYRQLIKLKNTYIDKLPEMINERTGRIHASFNQTVTATGRLSSSEPNLQNIPIRSELGQQIRAAFVPADPQRNVLLTCDYSQIELRLLAHFSKDPSLVKAFREDLDIHSFVASQVFGVDINLVTSEQRRVAKTVNFGLMYGQTAHGLAQTIGVTRTEAQKFIDAYFRTYSTVGELREKVVREAKDSGYAMTILGRRRPIPELHSRNPGLRHFGERTAFNAVVQGSAADLIKVAMIDIHEKAHKGQLPAEMLVQVHDELVFEAPRDGIERTAAEVSELMENAIKVDVPIKVDAAWGENWMEGK